MTLWEAGFEDALLERVETAVQPGDEIFTLSNKRRNVITAVERRGIWVETHRSKSRHSGPQLVPAWMIATAWNHLQRERVLSHSELLSGLNVKRSAFVIALLAQFDDVVVRSDRPIVIELVGATKT